MLLMKNMHSYNVGLQICCNEYACRPAGKPAQVTDGKVADHVQEQTSTHMDEEKELMMYM